MRKTDHIGTEPSHREIHKTAFGAEESAEWRYFQTMTFEIFACL